MNYAGLCFIKMSSLARWQTLKKWANYSAALHPVVFVLFSTLGVLISKAAQRCTRYDKSQGECFPFFVGNLVVPVCDVMKNLLSGRKDDCFLRVCVCVCESCCESGK